MEFYYNERELDRNAKRSEIMNQENKKIVGYNTETGEPIYEQVSSDINTTIVNTHVSRNKTPLIIVGCVITVIVLFLFGIFCVFTGFLSFHKLSKVNDSTIIKEVQEEFPTYTFHKVTFLNQNYKYPNKTWIQYEENRSIDFKIPADCIGKNPIHYKFVIQNGTVTVTDQLNQNLEPYTFQKITSVKNIMVLSSGQDCTEMYIILLTNDGKLYYRSNSKNMKSQETDLNPFRLDYTTLENEFEVVSTNYQFDKIGYSVYGFPSNVRRLGALTTTGEQVSINIYFNGTVSEPYRTNLYYFLTYQFSDALLINVDGKAYFQSEQYLTDENKKAILVNYAFYDNRYLYLIDREGYLYRVGIDNKSTVLRKYSDHKVVGIGTNSNEKKSRYILAFDSKETLMTDSIYSKFGIDF